LKGRIFESAQCGSLILTDGEQFIKQYFEPIVECVIFNGKEDLLNKCKFYVEHEDERKEIALRAYNRSISEYSASKWWDRLLSFATTCPI
jgi:spore maturation protein CgeB